MFGSRIIPIIVGLTFMGSVILSISCSSCVLYSAGSGVKSTSCSSSQNCVLHDFLFVNAGRGYNRRKYERHTPKVPTTPACTWWNRPEEDISSGKLESTHPSRTIVKSIEFFYGV